jgi:interleukin-like EMT inducer protein
VRRVHGAVFLLMLGLVGLYTWPLVTDLAHLFPDNPDPRTLDWVMLTVFRNLATQPGALLHGNAFYPVGLSLTFTEPLLTPALVGGPLHALTGNPVLAYNVTLLLFWAFSGWAMYAVAWWLTRDHAAALIAAAIFTLAPYRTEMYLEFQMEILFGIPLAVYALVRFLETQRARYLWAFALVFWLQAVAVLYYAVILACGLAVVGVQYVALRWAGWRARTVAIGAVVAGALGLALWPVVGPFFVTRRELGFERGLEEIQERSAELLTYLELRPNYLYRVVPAGYYYETSLFMGGLALLFAALALFWLRRGRLGPPGWPERALAVAVVVACALAGLTLASGGRIGRPPKGISFSAMGVALLGCLLALQLVEGWRRYRAGLADRRLEPRDWVLVLLGLTLFAFLLSLGPVVHLARQPIGPGLYAWLYPYVVPLRGLRAATRVGVLVVFAAALLAAFGVTWLRTRLPRHAFVTVVGVLGLLLGLEYATFPLAYGRVPSVARPVDIALQKAPADTVVLEWPVNVALTDADAMFRSIYHRKRIVNGYAGFVPGFLSELSGLLTMREPRFPVPAAEAALRHIYPLDLLVVRLEEPDLDRHWAATWRELRATPPPFLRFLGSYGAEDLWQVTPSPERGIVIERWVSYEFLREHPVMRARVHPLLTGSDLEQWVGISLNGRVVGSERVDQTATVTATLAPPYLQAAPNAVVLRFEYRRPPAVRDARYRIGTTGATSPGDLRVRSAGQPYGDAALIAFNGVEKAINKRGYNLVVLGPEGRVQAVECFDTFLDATAAPRLVALIGGLPAGTVVAGAVRDEASGRLTAEAVVALRSLGVAGDLRGRFRESHAFIGVKGAAPGTALEALGTRALALGVGRPPESAVGVELESFVLERVPSPHPR